MGLAASAVVFAPVAAATWRVDAAAWPNDPGFLSRGVVLSTIAGILGAAGALCIVFAVGGARKALGANGMQSRSKAAASNAGRTRRIRRKGGVEDRGIEGFLPALNEALAGCGVSKSRNDRNLRLHEEGHDPAHNDRPH